MPTDAGTYWVVVDGFGGSNAGAFTLNVDVTPEDPCNSAVNVGSGGVFTGTTSGVDGTVVGGCNGRGPQAYYSFTLSETSDVFASTHGSSFDTVLHLFAGSCTGTETACNDDQGNLRSVISQSDLPPGTYYLVVDGFVGASGDYRLEVQIDPADTAGDQCGEPLYLPAFTDSVSGNTCVWGNDTSACAGNGGEGVYYFVLNSERTMTFSTCNDASGYDTVLYLRDTCDAAGAEVACNDDDLFCADLESTITATLGPGIHYLFIDAWSSVACGDYQIDITGW